MRLACAEISALPLQLMLRRHPEWRRYPGAVVAEDAPQSPVLWVNVPARQAGVVPGLRYAAALSLVPDLRAAVVPQAEITAAIDEVTVVLRRCSPNVEPATDEPGIFWLDASGLEQLHPSLEAWACEIRKHLDGLGYTAVIVVGFTRFGTYAAARVTRTMRVFADRDEERIVSRRVPLNYLYAAPETLEALGRLGIRTVDDLLRLPAGGLLERFGPAIARLHRLASGDLWAPLVPLSAPEPVQRLLVLDAPESDAYRLLFTIKHVLHPLLVQLAARGQALAVLELRLRFGAIDRAVDPGGSGLRRRRSARAGGATDRADVETIRPAAPTLDAVRLSDLIRLRLENVRIEAGVTEVVLDASGVPASPEQLELMPEHPARDLGAGTRALDRLRARYGDGAVVCAVLREGHLPEARFAWEPVTRLRLPRPRRVEMRPLVRRVLERPVPLHATDRAAVDAGLTGPPVIAGPFLVSGGWWTAPPREDGMRETHRSYYYMEAPRGELWWVFYDQVRGRWYVHGRVE